MPLFRDILFEEVITKCLLSQGQHSFACSGFGSDRSDKDDSPHCVKGDWMS